MLPTLRGCALLGARDRSFRFTRRNRDLETMAGNAFSTLTGSALSLASTPHTRVPVYTSLRRMMWTPFLDQSLPVGLAMPSSLRVLVMSRMPVPDSAMSKMRSTTGAVAGSGSRVGRFLAPSCTMTLLKP